MKLYFMIGVLCLCALVGAAEEPATQPTSQPAVQVDGSTPQSAMRSYARALVAGDAQAMTAATTSVPEPLQQAWAEYLQTSHGLEEAMVARWGREAVLPAMEQLPFPLATLVGRRMLEELEQMDDDHWTIQDDRAEAFLSYGSGEVVRRDGVWRVVILPDSATDEERAMLTEATREMNKVVDHLAAEVKSGKFETLQAMLASPWAPPVPNRE